MAPWPPSLFWEAELKKTDDRLAAAQDDIHVLFERAIILGELGRSEEAKNAYIGILARTPSHFGALNNLGALLMSLGYTSAAITTYREAVKLHPANPKGHVNLADCLFQKQDLEGALSHFRAALQIDPDYKTAHQGLGYVLREMGDEENARNHRRKGFAGNSVFTIPYRGNGSPVVVLMLASSVGGMIPMRQHLDDRIFHTTVVFVEFYDPNSPLPPHQVIFNAIGDADLCQPDFELALALLKDAKAPIINPPDAVRLTGRVDNARRLSKLPSVITPRMALLPRKLLIPDMLQERGFPFPFLLRRPGFHTGQFFTRVTNAEELAAALAQTPGDDLLAMQYLDAKSADGKIRKYRVMMIDGQLYPLHAAVSREWKVHYFSADMANNPEHRAEDAAFLANMPHVLGARAMDALKRIQTTLGLDYAGIDFGLSAEGEIILFEANATMTVNPPEAGAQWDYRRAPVKRIQDAIRSMLVRRAGQP